MSARVLVLAGLDPSGRAGLLADGEAIRAAGASPLLCATAIAAQSQGRLVRSEPVRPDAIAAQVEGVLEDGPVGAVKVGMVGTRAALKTLLKLAAGPLAKVPWVVDPVLRTSSGGALFEGDPDELYPLFERARLVTPNLDEAAALSGITVTDEALMPEAATRIALRGAKAVLLKGGHLGGAPSDVLLDGNDIRWFRGDRLDVKKRGTGCRLASAIAASLAQGRSLDESVNAGREHVRRYLSE